MNALRYPSVLPAVLASALGLLTLTGCGGPDTDLEQAFCDLLAAPEVAYTATVDTEQAPTVDLEDTHVELELEADGEYFSGSVIFAADEAGTFAFGLSEDVPFAVTDLQGRPASIINTERGSEACAELVVRHTVEMEVKDYLLIFGPADVDEVDLVGEESDDDLS